MDGPPSCSELCPLAPCHPPLMPAYGCPAMTCTDPVDCLASETISEGGQVSVPAPASCSLYALPVQV